MNGPAFVKTVERARVRCAETKKTYIVIEIDKEDYREITIRKEEYLNDPEFEAFDGVVLAEVYLDDDSVARTGYVRNYA
jgi:hypothetical protein